jgi:hypothetical protein
MRKDTVTDSPHLLDFYRSCKHPPLPRRHRTSPPTTTTPSLLRHSPLSPSNPMETASGLRRRWPLRRWSAVVVVVVPPRSRSPWGREKLLGTELTGATERSWLSELMARVTIGESIRSLFFWSFYWKNRNCNADLVFLRVCPWLLGFITVVSWWI